MKREKRESENNIGGENTESEKGETENRKRIEKEKRDYTENRYRYQIEKEQGEEQGMYRYTDRERTDKEN